MKTSTRRVSTPELRRGGCQARTRERARGEEDEDEEDDWGTHRLIYPVDPSLCASVMVTINRSSALQVYLECFDANLIGSSPLTSDFDNRY